VPNVEAYGCQLIDDEDVKLVAESLSGSYLTQGPEIERFETALCDTVQAPFGIAVSSASAGLHIAMMAIGVGPGDVVWTTPITFVATATCAIHQGASIDFIDIDRHTWNLDIDLIEHRLHELDATGKKLPKAIIAVHFAGLSCDMKRLRELTNQFGILLIEDAAHALGAHYMANDRSYPVGCSQHSDITVFSFHPVKPITTGEGGLVTTRSEELASKLFDLRSHGITRDYFKFKTVDPPPWWYEQQHLGLNYRMTDIQAALGQSQLKKLSSFISKRRALSQLYRKYLKDTPIEFQETNPGFVHAHHIEIIKLANPSNRLGLFKYLQSKKIGVNVHYIPIYKQPIMKSLNSNYSACPAAENYYSKVITIPLHTRLDSQDVEFVSNNIKEFLGKS
jgi:UDP-4-amino-4,6-dideoxy-N-acetyl-beta-L-altrosamine transaminase